MQDRNCNISAEDKVLNIIDSYSIKEKKYITIDKINEDIRVGVDIVQKILDSLVSKNVLKRKFIFKCPNEMCDEVIEVSEVDGRLYICDECNTEFNPLNNRSNLLDIVYEYIIKGDARSRGISYTNFFKDKVTSEEGVISLEEVRNKNNEKEKKQINKENKMKKIFISHSDADKEIIKKFVKLLKDIGVPKDKEHIFCSSYKGLGVDAGRSIPEYIKNELEDDVLVLFMFSENYYSSPNCLCEMGATWVKTHDFIPIVIPPFEFKAIKGFIDTSTLAIDLCSDEGLDNFKGRVVNLLKLSEPADWESDRDEFLDNVKRIINK